MSKWRVGLVRASVERSPGADRYIELRHHQNMLLDDKRCCRCWATSRWLYESHTGDMARCVGRGWDGSSCGRAGPRRGGLCARHSKCRAATTKDKPCEKVGTPPDGRCSIHRGRPLWVPKKYRAKVAASRAEPHVDAGLTRSQRDLDARKRRKRERKIAEACGEILANGGADFILGTASEIVGKELCQRLLEGHRRRHCVKLARSARKLLDAKGVIHKALGGVVYWLLGLLGWHDVIRLIARKFVENLPVLGPVDAKFTAVARALQSLGICLCFIDGRDLMKCACLRDLAADETKERVKQLLTTEWETWSRLLVENAKRA